MFITEKKNQNDTSLIIRFLKRLNSFNFDKDRESKLIKLQSIGFKLDTINNYGYFITGLFKCNEIVKPVDRIFYSVLLDDGTGNMRANVGGEVGEKLLNMSLSEMKNLLDEEMVDEAPIKSRLADLLGKEYLFTGKVRFSDFSKSNELQLRDFKEIDIEEEINYMLNELERE